MRSVGDAGMLVQTALNMFAAALLRLRLWHPNGMYPGTQASARIDTSLKPAAAAAAAKAAKRIGVFAEPEPEFRHLGSHNFLIVNPTF